MCLRIGINISNYSSGCISAVTLCVCGYGMRLVRLLSARELGLAEGLEDDVGEQQ